MEVLKDKITATLMKYKIDILKGIMTEFASYLHNPYGYPSDIQKASILYFTRISRFVSGYDPLDDLDSLILKNFSNIRQLHDKGLKFHYDLLKQTVIETNKIGLIIMGADKSKDDRKYYDYKTLSNNIIALTRQSICYCLLKEYFDDNVLDNLCKNTPNFNIYYKSIKKMD